jgi:hypothetical protein
MRGFVGRNCLSGFLVVSKWMLEIAGSFANCCRISFCYYCYPCAVYLQDLRIIGWLPW